MSTSSENNAPCNDEPHETTEVLEEGKVLSGKFDAHNIISLEKLY